MEKSKKKSKEDIVFTKQDLVLEENAEDSAQVKQESKEIVISKKTGKKKKKQPNEKRAKVTPKTLYKGKYELLPEKENRKQIRFRDRIFTYSYTALITGIFAVLFAIGAIIFNRLLAFCVVLCVISGLFWGLVGLIKLKAYRRFYVLLGLGLNIIAISISVQPLMESLALSAELLELILQAFQL